MPVQFSMKELRTLHAFHTDTLAYRASVPEQIVIDMLKDQPVCRRQAEKVLLALSNQTGRHYTFSNVNVTLTPKISFIELRNRHHFDICELAWHADSDPKPGKQSIKALELIIYKMLVGEPVHREDALRILATLSRLIKATYTLEDISICFNQ